jgi:hypothetical protein
MTFSLDWVMVLFLISEASTLTAPISLTMTAILRPWLVLSTFWRSVVLPLPRKPDSRVTGRGALGWMAAAAFFLEAELGRLLDVLAMVL